MNVEVKLFAAAREMAGTETVQITVHEPVTVGSIREILCREHPAMAVLVQASLFALDAHYCNDDTKVTEGVEIACIPPVSGG